jgi:hypothetical protein
MGRVNRRRGVRKLAARAAAGLGLSAVFRGRGGGTAHRPPPVAPTGGGFYQDRDRESHDYETYELAGNWWRGPDPWPLDDREYIAFMGAAQTFGPYAERPFPRLIGDATGLATLNLGIGGAGPRAFLEPVWLEWVNRSRFAVLQVMSGRSAGNSLMQQVGGNRRMVYGGEEIAANEAWERASADLATPELWTLVDETRAQWTADYAELMARITVPKVLLYISARAPITSEDRSLTPTRGQLWNGYPQLVTQAMVDEVKGMADRFAESVTSAGRRQTIRSRSTGSS